MKNTSEKIKGLESEVKELQEALTSSVAKIPNLTWDGIPIGKSDEDNPVTGTWGEKPEFDFEPKPYYELEIYKELVDQKTGADVMGARGYFMR